MPPEYAKLIPDRINKILSSGNHLFESAHTNRDGKVTPVEVSATAIEYDDRKAILSVTRDITERKQAEEFLNRANKQLRESEEKYRILADSTPDLIYSLDREARLTAVNQSVCRVLGRKESEIIGKNHRELGFPEETVREWDDLHAQVFNNGKVVQAETTFSIPGGSVSTYEVILMPVLDENDNGTVTAIRGASRDITERKKMEEEILRMDKLESIGMLAAGMPMISTTTWPPCWEISR